MQFNSQFVDEFSGIFFTAGHLYYWKCIGEFSRNFQNRQRLGQETMRRQLLQLGKLS